jgi:tryptophan-rich sensory protein
MNNPTGMITGGTGRPPEWVFTVVGYALLIAVRIDRIFIWLGGRGMNFKRMIDILTIFFVVVVLTAIFLHSCQRQALKAEITSLSAAGVAKR